MPTLLAPFEIKTLHLQNRIVFPPMANYFATEQGEATDDMLRHYAARASHIGLVIVEHTYVTPLGRVNKRQPAIDRDELIPGLARLAGAVHDAGGKVGIQITHGGSAAPRDVLGEAPVGPSAITHPRGGDVPRELGLEELPAIVTAFSQAAVRAKKAGFDMVEIHGAHGYLLNQFYSPLTNHRADEYGGTRDNRLRLTLEVLRAVREAVGPEYPVFIRFGADDRLPGGLTLADAQYAAPRVVEAGADVLDISGGHVGSRPEGAGPAYFVPLAVGIKAVTSAPVLVTGGITEPDQADRIIREGKADLVGIGRAMFSDPEWGLKAAAALK